MLTRVVEDARVSAMVKRAHIAALKRRFRPKKVARTRNSMGLLVGERCRRVERAWDQVEVRAVVVLDRMGC